MKKVKQILAIIGIIILVGLYLSTLIFAAIGSESAMDWFRVSIYSTVVLPVLIWAYGFVYRLLKNHYSVQEDTDATADMTSDEESASETPADDTDEVDNTSDATVDDGSLKKTETTSADTDNESSDKN